MTEPAFVHLRVRSEFSLRDSIIRLPELARATRDGGMDAVALTDSANLFGAVTFFQACRRAGVKPIIGADVGFFREASGSRFRALLLCMNDVGYRNLCRIVSAHYDREADADGQRAVPVAIIEQYHEGLLLLSGGTTGDVAMVNEALAVEYARRWQQIFADRYYLEVQRLGCTGEHAWITRALDLAITLDLPLAATHEPLFIRAEDDELHEIRACIARGEPYAVGQRERRYSPEQYLVDAATMADRFRDLPDALANTVAISRRTNFCLPVGAAPVLPVYRDQRDNADEGDVLAQRAGAGLNERLVRIRELQPTVDEQVYRERLAHELTVIQNTRYAGYYLIVADYVNWAKANDIPVGPGRGSGAGSLVAYCIGITDVDPIRFDLLFERFLNPERISLPDFDVDFCAKRRNELFGYLTERYGAERVAHIITFGTMKTRRVVRDVARGLGFPPGLGERIVGAIEANATLQEMIADEDTLLQMRLASHRRQLDADPDLADAQSERDVRDEARAFFLRTDNFRQLYQGDEQVRDVVDRAMRLEGLASNISTHAAGVIIADNALTDYCPIYRDEPGGMQIIHFEMKSAEAVGLVKFDILGLRTLTTIDRALTALQHDGKTADLPTDVFDDPRVYELLRRQLTTGIFQLESAGMRRMLEQMHIECFEELMAALALYRPGPLGTRMNEDFINRKHGKETVSYAVPALEPIVADTRGVILYQEQVMHIAQAVAGFTFGQADTMRKAMGKKDAAIMEGQKRPFVDGGLANGYSREQMEQLFAMIEKFAAYGFNKSHTVSYAIISYQTAWLKTYYPAYFIAADMTSLIGRDKELYRHWSERGALGLTIDLPSIQEGDYAFCAIGDKQVRFGLGAIKGVGRGMVEEIVRNRRKHGDFASIDDVCARLDSREVNKGGLEALIDAGAMDALSPHGRLAKLTRLAIAHGQRRQLRTADGKMMPSLFGEVPAVETRKTANDDEPLLEMRRHERIVRANAVYGFDVADSVFDVYAEEFANRDDVYVPSRLLALPPKQDHAFWLIARLLHVAHSDESGERIVTMRCGDDAGESLFVRAPHTRYAIWRSWLREKMIVAMRCEKFDGRYGRCDDVVNIADFRSDRQSVCLLLDEGVDDAMLRALQQFCAEPKTTGHCPLYVRCETNSGWRSLWQLPQTGIYPTDATLDQFARLIGEHRVAIATADTDWLAHAVRMSIDRLTSQNSP